MLSKSVVNYYNKLILAPMVRGSLLPMRLLALKYGAHLVYNEEIIDFSMLSAKRKVNDVLGTIDYVNEENAFLLFRTSPLEKEQIVFQMGTRNPERAVRVAKMVEQDVSAIDINMGCPKKYSTSLGIGAALLSNVEAAKNVVRNLVENIQLPITCKIRISDDIDQTIQMVKDFESLGVSAVAVHGRTKYQSFSEAVNKDAIRRVAENVNIPIIANGGSFDFLNHDDMLKFKEDCGCSSVMVARAAQENISIFRKEGLLSIDDLIMDYLKLCVDYDNDVNNTKYALTKMHKHLMKSERSKVNLDLAGASSLEEICDLWHLGDYCREKQYEYKTKGLHSLRLVPCTVDAPSDLIKSREQIFSAQNVIFAQTEYIRKHFGMNERPKDILNVYAGKNKITPPIYETTRTDRLYYSIVTFQDKKYASLIWHRERRYSEHAAALVVSSEVDYAYILRVVLFAQISRLKTPIEALNVQYTFRGNRRRVHYLFRTFLTSSIPNGVAGYALIAHFSIYTR